MYVASRQLGVIPITAIPVAASVAKNTIKFLSRLFGGKLVWGLKKGEFEQRHNNRKWFRYLWYNGYWTKDGAAELPQGMSVQDYYVTRFKGIPFFASSVASREGLRRKGVPLSTLRLTVIPAGMQWPPDMPSIPMEAILRVLPKRYSYDAVSNKIIRPQIVRLPVTPVTPVTPVAPVVAQAGVFGDMESPVVLIGVGLLAIMLLQGMRQPERME